jgi:hypothetical protein
MSQSDRREEMFRDDLMLDALAAGFLHGLFLIGRIVRTASEQQRRFGGFIWH